MRHVFKATKLGWNSEKEGVWFDSDRYSVEEAKAKLELFDAHMAAYGYVPVIQEDGTIIYINEQENLIAYEE